MRCLTTWSAAAMAFSAAALLPASWQERDVVGAVLPHRGRAGRDRLLRCVVTAGSVFVFDLDQLGRVLRLSSVSATPRPPARRRSARGRARAAAAARRTAASRRGACAAAAAAAGRARARRGRCRSAPGSTPGDCRARCTSIETMRGMRMRRAQHIGARLTDELHVVDIAAGAAHQIRVFLARDRLANSKFTHDVLKCCLEVAARARRNCGMRRNVSRHCFRGVKACQIAGNARRACLRCDC